MKKHNGHFLLAFGEGTLLELRGVLYDDGPVVRYEAWLTKPDSIIACEGCERQPLHGVFRGAGREFRGVFKFRRYYSPCVPLTPPKQDVKFEEADDPNCSPLSSKKPLPSSERPSTK